MILNDEQRMLRDTIADFLSREAPVETLRVLRDEDTDLAWPTRYGLVSASWARRAQRMQKMTAAGASVGWVWARSCKRPGAPCARATAFECDSCASCYPPLRESRAN